MDPNEISGFVQLNYALGISFVGPNIGFPIVVFDW
jgi:hypothetical protein